jgi:hypothetical protein
MAKKGVGSNAFKGQSEIVSAKLGEQCFSVGINGFKDCESLMVINENNVVESIEDDAFAGCTSLRKAIFANVATIKNNAFNGCSNLEFVGIPRCNDIGSAAFENCNNLINVERKGLTKNDAIISSNAFRNCSKLKNIYLDNCVNIKSNAFENCKSLDKVLLNKCEFIEVGAFKGCDNMTQVVLSNCRLIASDAFVGCPNLSKVYINNPPSIICKLENETVFGTFDDSDSDNGYIANHNITFYFRADTLDTYKEIRDDLNWNLYKDYMVSIPNEYQIIYKSNNGQAIYVDGAESNNYYLTYGLLKFRKTVSSLEPIFKNAIELTSVDLPHKCNIISANAFEGCKNLISIMPSDILDSIGDYAFKGCESLTSFTIPESITSLGEGIFAGCKNIEKFSGNFVTEDETAIVYNNTLICVVPKNDSESEGRIYNISDIDTSIKKLGKSCFHGCLKLRRVDIPFNIKNIGDYAFEECKNLCEIYFNGNIPPTMGKDVFKDARKDFKIFVDEENLSIYHEAWKGTEYVNYIYPKPKDDSIIYYCEGKASNIFNQVFVNETFANGTYYKISKIKNATLPTEYFSGKTNITKVLLGDGITKISKEAFKNCTKLDSIHLSDNVTEFGDRCFYGCSSLTRIHIPIGLIEFTLNNGLVVSNTTNTSAMTNIGGNINNTTNNLNYVYITDKDYFGEDTFYNCSSLKEFGTYHKGYVTDDNRCYIYNSKIKFFAPAELLYEERNYVIPDNITTINRSAFRNAGITSIRLNPNTKIIGDYAFEGCSSLREILDWDNVETISKGAFNGCSTIGKVTLPSNLKEILDEAFKDCSRMFIDMNIPDSVVVIGKSAFMNCSNFNFNIDAGITLSNITYINESAFYGCKSLTNVNINDKITLIDSSAFEGCNNLKYVTISSKSQLNSINEKAFKDCRSLETLYLPNTLSYIGNSSFENCVKYKGNSYRIKLQGKTEQYLTIPINVSSMGNACFKKSGIEELNIPYNSMLSTIPDSAFCECSELKSINIMNANNIQTICSKAFKDCINLCVSDDNGGILSLPNSVENIGYETFCGCKNILSVTLPLKLKKIGSYSFATGTSNTNIYIPTDLKTPPIFTINEGTGISINSIPFGDVLSANVPTIFVPASLYDTYKTNISWGKYKSNFVSVNEKSLEDYIGIIEITKDGAYIPFVYNIPSSWVGAKVEFKVYNANKILIPHPQNLSWEFILNNKLSNKSNMPYNFRIAEGNLTTLGGTDTNPAKYIKIVNVSKSDIYCKYNYINITSVTATIK